MSSSYSPSYDNKIEKKFSARTLESKIENKLAFQKELGWVSEPKMPLLCIPGGMDEDKGGPHFEDLIPGILSLNCQIVVRGIGSRKYGEAFTKLEKENSHRIKIIQDTDDLRRQMYAAADISLFFSESPSEEEITNCLAYGAVPISAKHALLSNYDPVQESGNSFLAAPFNPWGWFAALVRAIETYKLPYDWRTIQRHAMESVKEEK